MAVQTRSVTGAVKSPPVAMTERATSGDFPGLVLYYYDVFSRGQEFMGIEPDPAWIALAHDYLRRCGRFRLKLATSSLMDGSDSHDAVETSREFHLQWEGEVTSITIERGKFPTLPVFLPPHLVDLSVYVGFGEIDLDHIRTLFGREKATRNFLEQVALVLGKKFHLEDWSLDSPLHVALTSGWEFKEDPLRAILARDDRSQIHGPGGTITTIYRLEVIFEHDPL